MQDLNLKANGRQEELVLDYLKENVSNTLAEKINKGVHITKDGKELVNLKTLDGFMKYACQEAQKQAPKGATGTFIENEVVYGWAIHYFEEDSIEEELYNLDGTEYKPEVKTVKSVVPVVKKQTEKPKESSMQYSIFDMMDEQEEEQEEPVKVEEQPISKEKPKGSPLYQQYMELQAKYPDCIVAYRLGDFYEIFGENAKKVSAALDLTLTSRDCGLEERVPMVGYPYHVADLYVAKLIDKGFKVAIAETMTDIRKLQKETKNNVSDKVIPALLELFEEKLEVRL